AGRARRGGRSGPPARARAGGRDEPVRRDRHAAERRGRRDRAVEAIRSRGTGRRGRTMTMRRILVVDAEPARSAALGAALERGGFAVVLAATAESALARVAAGPVDLVVLDLALP